MPARNPHPPICLTARLDVREWDNTHVLTTTRGGVSHNVFITDYDLDAGEGWFNCPLQFLHHYGSNPGPGAGSRALGQRLTYFWDIIGGGTTGNVVTVSITEDDLVRIHSSVDDFTLDAGTANTALGFAAGGAGATAASGGGYELIATSDWVRGLVTGYISVTPVIGGAAPITIDAIRCQSVPTWVRESTEADDDGASDVALVFERLLVTATGVSSWRTGLDDTGHMYIAVDNGDYAWSAVTWADTDFRDRMGYTGNETLVTSGTVTYLTADRVFPGVHVAASGLEYLNPGNVERGEALPMVSGAWASNLIATIPKWNLGFRLGGPADETDQHQNWLRSFIRYAWPGSPVTLYQHWGDPRRYLMDHQITAEQPAYDTLYTSERNGYQGRIDTHRSGDDPKDTVIQWGGKLRSRALVTMTLAGER